MFRKVFQEIKDLRENSYRIWVLTKNELKMEFGQSKLGLLWSLLEPLGILLVYSIIFPVILGSDFYSWVLFFIAGFVPHRFLQNGIVSASQTLVDNKNILNQMNIKEEVIPISSVLADFIKFLIECSLFFSIVFISGVLPNSLLIIFPLLAIIEFMLVLGFGMHLSVSYINLRDLDHILNIFFQALFFLTPIVYRLSKIPGHLRGIYLLNPISRLILLYQGSLLNTLGNYVQYIPVINNLILLFVFSSVVLIMGYISFGRRKDKYMGEI